MCMQNYSLSLHQEGDLYRRGHNVRLGISISKSGNVNALESHRNIILVDIQAREAYEKIFSAAVEEFNARQKNYDRKIRNYYDKIHQDSQKHNVYEMIVQIGSKEDGYPDRAATLLMNYAVSFESRNHNLRVIGAYIHLDEETPHLHLDYIPVAECNRGMKLQNSLTGALKAQGFKSRSSKNTAQMQWEKSERLFLRQMCKNMNIPLRDEGKGRKKHFSVPEYKAMKEDLKAAELELGGKLKEIDKLDAELQDLQNRKNNLQMEHENIMQEINSSKVMLQELQDKLQNGINLCQQVQEYCSFDNVLSDMAEQFGLAPTAQMERRAYMQWQDSAEGEVFHDMQQFEHAFQDCMEDISL